jgi:hypothetical protein
MATIPKTARRQSAKERERTKKLNVFKTAVPLVLTVLLLGVVYVLVLLPDSPEVVLKRALYNSLDQTKQKSWRYDGSFGDKDNGFSAEYSGQKSNTGDTEFFIKLAVKDQTASYHIIQKGTDRYYLVSGTTNIPTILAAIPGAQPPDQATSDILNSANNSWIKVSESDTKLIRNIMPCSANSISLPTTDQLTSLTGTNLPLQITGGPYAASDGTQTRIFEVGLKKGRTTTAYETGITNLVNCLDGLRTNDYRLRKVSSQDIDAFRVNITVDPLSNMITHVIYGAFSQYFQLSLRDFNKDVTVSAPESSISLSDFILKLDDQTRAELQAKIGPASN